MSKHQPLNKLGSLIKEARAQRGWSQDELAYESRVSVAHIKNIEDANRSELPEEAYLLGFINKILRALNFKNPDQLIDQYKKEEGYQVVQSIVDAHSPSDDKFGFSFADFKVYQLYTVFVIALLLLLWFTIANYRKNNIDLNLLNAAANQATRESINGSDFQIDLSGNSVVGDLPQRSVTAGSGSKILDVQIANNAWCQIIGVSQKKILFEGDVGPSYNFDHFKFSDDQGFVLSTGDAGAFVIDAGNGPFKLGKTGETIKWYYPQTARTIYKSWDENTTVEKAELPVNEQANNEISNNDVMAINQPIASAETEVKSGARSDTPSTYNPQEQQLVESPIVKRSAVVAPVSEPTTASENIVTPPVVKRPQVQPIVTGTATVAKKIETKKSAEKKDKKKKKKKDKKKSED